jgi:hypothetical protein
MSAGELCVVVAPIVATCWSSVYLVCTHLVMSMNLDLDMNCGTFFN